MLKLAVGPGHSCGRTLEKLYESVEATKDPRLFTEDEADLYSAIAVVHKLDFGHLLMHI